MAQAFRAAVVALDRAVEQRSKELQGGAAAAPPCRPITVGGGPAWLQEGLGAGCAPVVITWGKGRGVAFSSTQHCSPAHTALTCTLYPPSPGPTPDAAHGDRPV